MADERNELIALYFELGLTYKDIVLILLARHGVSISERHCRRILRVLKLNRRKYSDLQDAVNCIRGLLAESGELMGYRAMRDKCQQMGISVKFDDVRLILRELDPEGVELRRAKRLRRRSYFAKGPNFVWHFDGYDKLKPFGLCISGCICGFSRHLIWLNVYHTNNNPKVIGGYFLESVKSCGGCPRIIRGDCGTENVNVRAFQQFLRRNCTDPEISRAYISGPSTSNQRIESFWGILRKTRLNFWIELMKSLDDRGMFDGSFLDKSLIQFSFTSLIQVCKFVQMSSR